MSSGAPHLGAFAVDANDAQSRRAPAFSAPRAREDRVYNTSELYRWMACSDPRSTRDLTRRPQTVTRIAQLTDPHVPSDISLWRRLRDLMRLHGSASDLSLELSAISNELSQPFRKQRKIYTNILKKALLGLRMLEVDHLIITGDIAHCGLSSEFLEMKAALSITGWWGKERLTVIPGNHDRFNLYEEINSEPMEKYFDVVSSRKPRQKILPGGIVLLELDSNADRVDDRHYMERWLPNTMGKIYPEALDSLEKTRAERAGCRVLTLIHHHVSMDWYPRQASRDLGGLMIPAQGVDDLMAIASLTDPEALILHGHIHDVMPPGYLYKGHLVGNPGGFAESLRINLIDIDANQDIILTQAKLR